MQFANEFDESLKSVDYSRILKKVSCRKLRGLYSKEEIESTMMTTLWKCVKGYNKNKNVKFTTYLYFSIRRNVNRLYSKKIKSLKDRQLIENLHAYNDNNKREVFEILESVKDINKESYDILIQKFYYNMTNREIGEIYGCTGEAARKKVKKALELCRKIVYN